MSYTVNKLAKLSGVSIRTLHFYDEVGLLKPAHTGENNYRYYEQEQLLMLQQILFYRELGFPLNEIKEILSTSDFDKVAALKSHRKTLEQRIDQTHSLIKTIDKTISHIRGKTKMKDEEMYYGFDSETQRQHEKTLVAKGIVTQEFMNECKEKSKKFTKEDEARFMKEGKDINLALIAAIEKKLKPSSPEVQAIMRRHHAWVGWNPTREKYIGLSQLYQSPEFSRFYTKLHPELLAFIVEAMQIFADKEL